MHELPSSLCVLHTCTMIMLCFIIEIEKQTDDVAVFRGARAVKTEIVDYTWYMYRRPGYFCTVECAMAMGLPMHLICCCSMFSTCAYYKELYVLNCRLVAFDLVKPKGTAG